MCVGATGAELVVGNDFEEVLGAQLASTAVGGEGVVIGLETFGFA